MAAGAPPAGPVALLLDTDMASALHRPDRDPQVTQWVAVQQPADLFLSAVTIGEIRRGITQQERRNEPFSRELAVWLAKLLTLFGDRVLAFDVPAAQRWGRLSAYLGHDSIDLMVAATALEHGQTVVTGNVSHFEPTGVRVLNPFGQPGKEDHRGTDPTTRPIL